MSLQASGNWEHRPCPLCNSEQHILLANSRAKIPAESLNFEEVRKYFVGFREEQIFFTFYRCSNCDLLYSPEYFSKKQLDILYADMPDNLLGEDKSIISKTHQGYVKQISKMVKKSSIYLEIGPDIGLVTRSVISQFRPNRIILIEPNLAVREELLHNSKSNADVTIIDDVDVLGEQRPDLIVGVHVYDHLLDPLDELNKLNSKSAPGAKIALVVHNEKSLIRKILGKKWPPFCLQHPQLYNKKTIKRMLELAGWKVVSIQPTINWFSLRHFARMGGGLIGINPKLFSLVPNIQIPIKLGNMICIAEKRAA
jgi:hypothetical protein